MLCDLDQVLIIAPSFLRPNGEGTKQRRIINKMAITRMSQITTAKELYNTITSAVAWVQRSVCVWEARFDSRQSQTKYFKIGS